MGKMYGGNRSLDSIRKRIAKADGTWDQTAYNRGEDWVNFTVWLTNRGNCAVLYNVVNGRFMMRLPSSNAAENLKAGTLVTEESVEFDGMPWYDQLLNIIYKPLPKKVRA